MISFFWPPDPYILILTGAGILIARLCRDALEPEIGSVSASF
jgi:hypothetical protein